MDPNQNSPTTPPPTYPPAADSSASPAPATPTAPEPYQPPVSKFRKYLPLIAATILVLIIGLVIAGLLWFQDTDYPQEVRQNYINGCIQSGGQQSTCTCTLEYVENHLSYEDFLAVDTTIQDTGQAPANFTTLREQALSQCSTA